VSEPVAIVGAGGHAKVIVGLLRALELPILGCFDGNPAKRGSNVLGAPILALEELPETAAAVLGIGDNRARKRLSAELRCRFRTLVHPRAFVDPSVTLGEGTVVFAGAVVQPSAVLGAHVIVNTSASIDHDCVIGDFVHVAPGCHLAGNVTLEEGTFLGIGTVCIPGRRVGAWTTVGAGGAIVRDLPGGVTAVGVPARPRGS